MSITLDGLTKRYQGNAVVSAVSLAMEKGELLVLLGPSGSGKSTLLRMIAGLTEPDAGRIFLHEREVTNLSPKERGIGFVFQHYALFRNLSVAENIEFSLRVRRVPARERRDRREELLEMVGLSGFGHRLPAELSGGQQQRVGLARALAHRPPVLLLDEPFGALDAKIRAELRQTLRRIQRELHFTAIFVTHDQEEAFELGDRVGVMHLGRLLEVGPPAELYLRPRSAFVANFLGVANLLVGEATPGAVRLGETTLPLGTEASVGAPRRVQVLLRPEDVEVARATREIRSTLIGRGVVEERAFVGSIEKLRVRLDQPRGVRQIAPAPGFGSGEIRLEVTRTQPEALEQPLAPGGEAWVGVRRAHVLAPARINLLVLSGENRQPDGAGEYARLLALRLGESVQRFPPAGPILAEERTAPGRGAAAVEPESLEILAVDPAQHGALPLPVLDHREPRHLLVVRPAGKTPSPPARILVCIAVGEPGKVTVRMAERLAWRLQAEVTVLTVLSSEDRGSVPEYVAHFLEASVRDLASRGVEAHPVIRRGATTAEILSQCEEGGHDLLIVGAPVAPRTPPAPGRRAPRLTGVVGRLVGASPCPVLVVQCTERT